MGAIANILSMSISLKERIPKLRITLVNQTALRMESHDVFLNNMYSGQCPIYYQVRCSPLTNGLQPYDVY